jgi:hypothetical protein
MNRLPQLFKLQAALEVLSQQTDVLPAVGGATEDELRPDADEIQDQEATKDDKLLDEPFEFGQSNTYVPLEPLKRPDDHVFRFFQDGSMRSFFIGTCLEHDRQTPVILGQVGCTALFRHDDGRLAIGPNAFRHVLMVAFSQISNELKAELEATVAPLGPNYYLADIESKGREGQDLRTRAADTMRSEMTKAEMDVLTKVCETAGPEKGIVIDGAVRIAQYDRLRAIYGDKQPLLVGVSKSFSKTPRFKIGRGRHKEINLWQLLADLPEGNRTLAFKGQFAGRNTAVWYQRLRMRAQMDYPLMGVIKVELPVLGTEPPPSELVTKLANALLAERTVTPHGLDRRWHAHLYPVFQAERCVKNNFVSNAILRAGLRWPPAKAAGSSK